VRGARCRRVASPPENVDEREREAPGQRWNSWKDPPPATSTSIRDGTAPCWCRASRTSFAVLDRWNSEAARRLLGPVKAARRAGHSQWPVVERSAAADLCYRLPVPACHDFSHGPRRWRTRLSTAALSPALRTRHARPDARQAVTEPAFSRVFSPETRMLAGSAAPHRGHGWTHGGVLCACSRAVQDSFSISPARGTQAAESPVPTGQGYRQPSRFAESPVPGTHSL